MQITLRLNGEDKTFTAGFISARMFRKAVQMQKLFQGGADLDETVLDEMVGFVVDAYGSRFTLDDFYDGVEASKLIETVTETITAVVNGVAKAAGADSQDPNASPAQ